MTFLYKADPSAGPNGRGCSRKGARAALPAVAGHRRSGRCTLPGGWEPPDDLAQRFPNLDILFSVGAGVDQFDVSRLPPDLPVVRMVEPGIVDGMVEYVTLATLALHRDLIDYIARQRARVWNRSACVRPPAVVSACWGWACSAPP